MLDYSPALMTDMYEYTMLDACLRDGTANRKCVFEIFTRHLPLGRHYGVAAGQGRILDALENFHLDSYMTCPAMWWKCVRCSSTTPCV